MLRSSQSSLKFHWARKADQVMRAVYVAFWMAIFSCAPWLASARAPGEPGLSLENISQKLGQDHWRWMAFVTGTQQEINRINCVVYTLHPTFPNPVSRVCNAGDPNHPFALTAEGWGTFNLLARVEY